MSLRSPHRMKMPGKDSSHLLGMTTMLESCHFERSEKSFSSVFSKEWFMILRSSPGNENGGFFPPPGLRGPLFSKEIAKSLARQSRNQRSTRRIDRRGARGRGVRSLLHKFFSQRTPRVSAVNSLLDRDSLDDHWNICASRGNSPA
jgi:hypothetical protein